MLTWICALTYHIYMVSHTIFSIELCRYNLVFIPIKHDRRCRSAVSILSYLHYALRCPVIPMSPFHTLSQLPFFSSSSPWTSILHPTHSKSRVSLNSHSSSNTPSSPPNASFPISCYLHHAFSRLPSWCRGGNHSIFVSGISICFSRFFVTVTVFMSYRIAVLLIIFHILPFVVIFLSRIFRVIFLHFSLPLFSRIFCIFLRMQMRLKIKILLFPECVQVIGVLWWLFIYLLLSLIFLRLGS